MKKLLVAMFAVVMMISLFSCNRGMSPADAASGRQKCGRGYIK